MTLTVGQNTYVTQAEANDYISYSLNSSAWQAMNDATKEAHLVTAARYIDRQRWSGERSSPSQPLSWPRLGVVDSSGNTVDSTIVPPFIKTAQIELALHLSNDPSFETKAGAPSNIKRVKAGSAEVEYFRAGGAVVFPSGIHSLLKDYLVGTVSVVSYSGGFASGTEECSAFEKEYRLSEGLN